MSDPSFDLEKPNILGGLDKLATNFAIAIIAVIPTFLTCIVRPWRLRALIDHEELQGRKGFLLSPGPFFIFALFVSFILAALLSTPETIDYNGSYIGPDLAVAVQSAASEGNIWKLVGTIMPIYGTAVLLGLMGAVLKPWASQDWSLRMSLRAAFYVIGTLVSWLILTTAVIDLIRLHSGNNQIASTLYTLISIPTIIALIWMYAGFFRSEGAISKIRSGALGLAMFGLILAVMLMVDLIARL